MEERLKSHYESLARAIEFTRSADTKAAPVLALQIALVGTLAARFDKLWVIVQSPTLDIESTFLISLLVLYGLSLFIVIWSAARVYIPTNPKTCKSLIYFEDIANMGYESFESKATKMSSDVIELQLLDQIHRVSQIASVKMHRVRRAFLWTFPSGILWFVLLIWGSISS